MLWCYSVIKQFRQGRFYFSVPDETRLPPAIFIRAPSIAPGAHIMLRKVAPVSLAIIGKCGQLIAILKRP
jgi:hypothetical protein